MADIIKVVYTKGTIVMKKNRSVRAIILTSIVSMFSTIAFAAPTQITDGFKDIKTIVTSFTDNVVTSLATLFATAAMVAFFFGIVQFIWGTRNADPTKMKNGKSFMVWGLVALFVMFSVWGIIKYVQTIFRIQENNTIVIPQIILQGGASGDRNAADPLQGGVNCNTAAAGTACPLGGGRTGTCGVTREGVKGCYVTPTCGLNQIVDANGNCAYVNGAI
jgi:succinate dehydrogenase/fumarate reductase cytochrome b subunit